MSENDLKEAIKDILEGTGAYGKLKAELRAHVFNALEKPSYQPKETDRAKEIELVNELVREYLEWSGCPYTNQVFTQERGLKIEHPSRSHILQQLNLTDTEESSKLPVLLGVISSFKQESKEI